jgi:phage terminase small subunit
MSRSLTERQRCFVDAYLVTRNARQAARDAGYSAARAGMTGSELLKKPHVAAALRARGLDPPHGVHPATQIRAPRTQRPRTRLSYRAERFALAYLVCGNAAEAARRAGAPVEKANAIGFRLLHRPAIAAFIEAERAASAERTRIDADRVTREYARIAFADIGTIAEWDAESFALTPSALIAPDDRAAIAEVKLKQGKAGLKATVRLHSKQHALDRLARLLGLDAKRPIMPIADPRAGRDPREILRERLMRIMQGEEDEAEAE